MSQDPDVGQVAAALRVSIGLLLRRLRQVRVEGELTLQESSALVRLDRAIALSIVLPPMVITHSEQRAMASSG